MTCARRSGDIPSEGASWVAYQAEGRRRPPHKADLEVDTLSTDMHPPRIDASTPTIRVNTLAGPEVAARIATQFPVDVVEDSLYPVMFAVPSAVQRAGGTNTGMAHPFSPWAAVAVGGPADGR